MASSRNTKTTEIEEKDKIKPQALTIIWGKESQYWDVPADGDKPAELLAVCWLEVRMSVEKDPSKSHAVGFCVSMSPDAYGWNNNPVYIIARRGKDNPRFVYRKVYLGKQGPNKNLYFGKHEPNKEFFLPADPDAYESLVVEAATGPPDPRIVDFDKIYFGLYEIWSGGWKRGLRIHYAFIKEVERPNRSI